MRYPNLKISPENMITFQVCQPPATHSRPASCAEVDCAAQAGGWQTRLDETTAAGQQLAAQVRRLSRCTTAEIAPLQGGYLRRYIETRDGAVTVFTFPAGQECFADHRVSLERPELYLVRNGDWRAPSRPRRHSSHEPWIDEFQTNLEATAARVENQ